MATIKGTAGNDALSGTEQGDEFRLYQGGDDEALGGRGDDIFLMRDAFTADDRLQGGRGFDIVVLRGDYSGGVHFDLSTITGIEQFTLKGNFDYDLDIDDVNVLPGDVLIVDARIGTNSLTFDGGEETDGSFKIHSGGGDDNLTGGNRSDEFFLRKGGTDIVAGGSGHDVFHMGGSFDATDYIFGSTGFDTLELSGLYYDLGTGDPFVITGSMIDGIDRIVLVDGGEYRLKFTDDVMGPDNVLEIVGSGVTNSDFLFDGSEELEGRFIVSGTALQTHVDGGGGNDEFDMSQGGLDDVRGHDGDDVTDFGSTFTSDFLTGGDFIDGGAGYDTMVLSGGGSLANIFDDAIINVEEIEVSGGGYILAIKDFMVASGEMLIINGLALAFGEQLIVDGDEELDGSLEIHGGASVDDLAGGHIGEELAGHGGDDQLNGREGTDLLYGGVGTDTLTGGEGGDDLVGGGGYDVLDGGEGDDSLDGGNGGDDLYGGAGADFLYGGGGFQNRFVYGDVTESSSFSGIDVIVDFHADQSDEFLFGFAVTEVGTRSGSVSIATFNTDMGSVVNDVVAGSAQVVSVTGGDFNGQTFLFVDADSSGVYESANDFLILLPSYTGTITIDNFDSF